MTDALRLVEWIIRDPWRDEGAVIVVAGPVAVETDFPCCEKHIVRSVGIDRRRNHVLVGKGIISSHSGVRYVSVLGFKILSSKTLLPTLVLAFSTSQRIFSMRSGAMKLA